MTRKHRRLAVVVVVVLAALALAGCGSKSGSSGTAEPAWTGTWTVTADFGNATLTVNKDGTLLTKVDYTFSCGAAGSAKGSVGATAGNPGWPVDSAGTFGFTNLPFYFNLLGSDQANTTSSMSGTFAKDGKSASGQWSLAVNDGTRCESSWTSTR